MTVKNNAKFEDELTCHFKTDARPKNLKKLFFNWLL